MSKVEGSVQAKRDAKASKAKADKVKVVKLETKEEVSGAKPTEGTSKAE